MTGTSQEELREQAREFVRGISATPVSGQFARWREPICAKTIGLAPEHTALVTEKVRSTARGADIRVAKGKCTTNVLIVFTDNADRDIAILRKKSGRALGNFDPVERRLLTEAQRPARWWYVTGIEGIDGHKPTGSPSGLLNAKIEGNAGSASLSGGMMSNGDTSGIDGYNSSLVGSRIRARIDQAVLIVDANVAQGRTLNSIAAYAALVTLARIRMNSAKAADDSILGLFTGVDPRPDDLTRRDKAFLAALYRVPPNREARQQERQIAVVMSKLLSETP